MSTQQEIRFFKEEYTERSVNLFLREESVFCVRVGIKEYKKFLKGEAFKCLSEKKVFIPLKRIDSINHLCMVGAEKKIVQVFYSKNEYSPTKYIVKSGESDFMINAAHFHKGWGNEITVHLYGPNGKGVYQENKEIQFGEKGPLYIPVKKSSWSNGYQKTPYIFSHFCRGQRTLVDYSIIDDIDDLNSLSSISKIKLRFPNEKFEERFLQILKECKEMWGEVESRKNCFDDEINVIEQQIKELQYKIRTIEEERQVTAIKVLRERIGIEK